MCTLIRHTRTHTQTLAQTHKLTLLCCWLQFYGAFGRLVQVITLVVSQSVLPLLLRLLLPLFFPSSLSFLTLALHAKSSVRRFSEFPLNQNLWSLSFTVYLFSASQQDFDINPLHSAKRKDTLSRNVTVYCSLWAEMSKEGGLCLLKGGNQWSHSATCWQTWRMGLFVWV